MNDSRIVAINRGERFSPRNTINDAMILEAVASELRCKGYEVRTISETAIADIKAAPEHLFLNMARGREALDILNEKESYGAIVINSPLPLIENTRVELTRKLQRLNVPIPRSCILNVGDTCTLPFPYWVKRGDECSQSPGDVSYISNHEALKRVWKDFTSRGISKAVACEHKEGDLIKFYGVASTKFFSTFLATDGGRTGKFEAERINGAPHGYQYSLTELQKQCDAIATALCIPVYGGDCVVDSTGQFFIIDFNDWPSYSRCRCQAAKAIAQLFNQQVCNNFNHTT